jgi:hypothetical protein
VNHELKAAHDYSDFLLKRVVELEKKNEHLMRRLLDTTGSLAVCRNTIVTQDLRIRQLTQEVNNLKFDNIKIKF